MTWALLSKHSLFCLFLLAYFATSLITYKHYGITDDEYVERGASNDLLRFISQDTQSEQIVSRDYNDSVFDNNGHHPLISRYQRSYQLLQNILNPTEYYEWDHLINLVFGSLLFIFAYILVFLNYKSSKAALIASVFLFLTPRLSGDIPTNNKDVPFAIMYLVSLTAIYITSQYKLPGNLKLLLIGVILGVTQTFRAVGFTLYLVYILYYLVTNLRNLTKSKFLTLIEEIIIIGLISLSISVSLFPWLGSNLIQNMSAFLTDSKSLSRWDHSMLFNGEFITKVDRPWHYLFTWIFITTPLFILIFYAKSVLKLKNSLTNPLKILLHIALIINIAIYLLLQPVVYNGLRHFLYLLPLITILAAMEFYEIIQNNVISKIYMTLTIASGLFVIYSYIILHPFQYIYFNELIGGVKGAYGRFETDYWGASYKEAADFLANKDGISQSDYVLTCENYQAVDYYSKKAFFMADNLHSPKYLICESTAELESARKGHLLKGKVIYEVERMGVVLNRVRQLY